MNRTNGMHEAKQVPAACLSRREFLLAGGSATLIVAAGCTGIPFRRDVALQVAEYPRKRIARLSEAHVHDPIPFHYPSDDWHFSSFLVRLDQRAAGGVGPGESIVAFNGLCTHMGGPVGGMYRAEHAVVGPCPFHLTTFDLVRHGMVVSGHATESLPQVRLEVVDGEIYATGVMGLIYGFDRNMA